MASGRSRSTEQPRLFTSKSRLSLNDQSLGCHSRVAGQGQGFEPTGTGNCTCFAAGSTGLVEVGPFFTLGLGIIGCRSDSCWHITQILYIRKFCCCFLCSGNCRSNVYRGTLTSSLSCQSICMSSQVMHSHFRTYFDAMWLFGHSGPSLIAYSNATST